MVGVEVGIASILVILVLIYTGIHVAVPRGWLTASAPHDVDDQPTGVKGTTPTSGSGRPP